VTRPRRGKEAAADGSVPAISGEEKAGDLVAIDQSSENEQCRLSLSAKTLVGEECGSSRTFIRADA